MTLFLRHVETSGQWLTAIWKFEWSARTTTSLQKIILEVFFPGIKVIHRKIISKMALHAPKVRRWLVMVKFVYSYDIVNVTFEDERLTSDIRLWHLMSSAEKITYWYRYCTDQTVSTPPNPQNCVGVLIWYDSRVLYDMILAVTPPNPSRGGEKKKETCPLAKGEQSVLSEGAPRTSKIFLW